jgi:hypothetical protein
LLVVAVSCGEEGDGKFFVDPFGDLQTGDVLAGDVAGTELSGQPDLAVDTALPDVVDKDSGLGEDTHVADVPGPDVSPDGIEADIVLDLSDDSGTDDIAVETVEDIVAVDLTGSGACDNPADLQVILSEDLAGISGSCAMSCIGQGTTCVVNCMRPKTSLSDPCLECFAAVVSCTVEKCAFNCLSPTSQGCSDCRKQKCGPAFEECAGFPMP